MSRTNKYSNLPAIFVIILLLFSLKILHIFYAFVSHATYGWYTKTLTNLELNFSHIWIEFITQNTVLCSKHFFYLGQQPSFGQGILIHEDSGSHTTTQHIR